MRALGASSAAGAGGADRRRRSRCGPGGRQAHLSDACHRCHAALPYTGRIGVENLPKFLANPRRYKPSTAMTFPGLHSKKDIEDVIADITGSQWPRRRGAEDGGQESRTRWKRCRARAQEASELRGGASRASLRRSRSPLPGLAAARTSSPLVSPDRIEDAPSTRARPLSRRSTISPGAPSSRSTGPSLPGARPSRRARSRQDARRSRPAGLGDVQVPL